MDGREESVLLAFYLDPEQEDIEGAKEYLKREGIDTEQIRTGLLRALRKKKARLKIEKGKNRIDNFFSELKSFKAIKH